MEILLLELLNENEKVMTSGDKEKNEERKGARINFRVAIFKLKIFMGINRTHFSKRKLCASSL